MLKIHELWQCGKNILRDGQLWLVRMKSTIQENAIKNKRRRVRNVTERIRKKEIYFKMILKEKGETIFGSLKKKDQNKIKLIEVKKIWKIAHEKYKKTKIY